MCVFKESISLHKKSTTGQADSSNIKRCVIKRRKSIALEKVPLLTFLALKYIKWVGDYPRPICVPFPAEVPDFDALGKDTIVVILKRTSCLDKIKVKSNFQFHQVFNDQKCAITKRGRSFNTGPNKPLTNLDQCPNTDCSRMK